jgi:ribosomal protein L37AE/L43A
MTTTPALGADKATDELPLCPFCNGRAVRIGYEKNLTQCTECKATADNTAWNRRAFLAAVPASEPVAKQFRERMNDGTWGKWHPYPDEDVLIGLIAPDHEVRELYAAAHAPVSGMPDLARLADGEIAHLLRSASKIVNAPSGSAPEVFAHWYLDNANLANGPEELASLAFDAGHALHHYEVSQLPAPQAPDTTNPTGEPK